MWFPSLNSLSDMSAGDYELIALPMKLKGADGAPARMVLRQD
jgi:arylformamidase